MAANTPPQGPTADTELYAHYPSVTDALTADSGCVTEKTTVVALYRYTNPTIDNQLLRNVTGVADVRIRCQVFAGTEDGLGPLPPSSENGKHGYDAFLTFNLLASAPSVRVEVSFTKGDGSKTSPYLKLALEFPFNNRDGKQLRDFQYRAPVGSSAQPTISFTSTGASSEGFTLIPKAQHQFTQEQKKAVKILRSLAAETKQLQIALHVQELATEKKTDFYKLISRLPGGNGHLLPSLGCPEFANHPIDQLGEMREPNALMTADMPNLMVPQPCPPIFNSIKHFTADNLGNAAMSDWESSTALQVFAKGAHKVALYGLKGIPIIAMKFGNPPDNTLMKAYGNRIPNELEIKITWAVPGKKPAEYTAVRDMYLQGLPEHDAYFVMTSHKLRWFHRDQYSTANEDPKYRPVLELKPHASNFLLRSLATAMQSLRTPRNERFHPIALGQSFDSLKPVDNTLGAEDEAWKWLLAYKEWNKEQRLVIEQLRCAKGGVAVATGTAGTGKTTVQMAMAVYMVKMGGRAACFATSNSNVETQAEALHELTEAIAGSDIRVIRIVSTSRGIGAKFMSEGQAIAKRVGHNQNAVSTIYGLSFMRRDQTIGQTGVWKHTLEACMLEEADKKELSLPFQYLDVLRKPYGPVLDAWEEFRRYLDLSAADEFWEDAADRELASESRDTHPASSEQVDTRNASIKQFAQAFEKCKGHLVALSDIIVTTNGNAQCSELVDYWGKAYENYQDVGVKKIKCLGVFIDEVGKEQELHVWNSIVSEGLPMVPNFVMLLGDPKQLSPVNTSVTKDVQLNAYAARGDVSMLDRLLSLDFPHTHLHVQQRMHPSLWDFPNREFYDEDAVLAPGLANLLLDNEPGLKPALDTFIADNARPIPGHLIGPQYLSDATDDQTRSHYLDFGTPTIEYSETGSASIPAQIDAVCDKLFPVLQEVFGDRTNECVMFIVGYQSAASQYHHNFHKLQESQQLDNSHYPRVLTIDASQGQEAKMVVVDCSIQKWRLTAFQKDRGRCNVALTRAKEVRWIVGGPLGTGNGRFCPFTKLKREMERLGQVHRILI